MQEQLIKQVNNNKDKQETYCNLLGRYKLAIRNEFFFEALIIEYALMEDRLKAFLYYCGFFTNRNTLKINKSIKPDLQTVLGDDMPDARKMSFIQNKIRYVRLILEWSEKTIREEIGDNKYLVSMKSQMEYLDVGGLLEVLELLAKQDGWLKYRNEIIHASMNKDISSLYEDLSDQIERGMEYARFIDSQVRILREKGKVRRILRLQNN